MSDVDQRAFRYPLEPVLRRLQWKLDALTLELGRTEKAIGEAQAGLSRMEDEYRSAAGAMRKASGMVLDPAAHGRGLRHLGSLQAALAQSRAGLDELRGQRRVLQDRFRQLQARMNVTAAHKGDCLQDYITAEQNRLSSERDREWLARTAAAREEEVHS